MRLLGLSLLGLACGIFLFQTTTTHSFYADAGDIPDTELWYSLQWQGNKVGFIKENWSRRADYLKWSQSLEIEGTARGEKFNRLSKEVMYFDLEFPYQLIGGSWFSDAGGQKQSFSFKVKHHQIQLQQATKTQILSYPDIWDAQKLWAPHRMAADMKNNLNATAVQFSRWDMQNLETKNFTINFADSNSNGEIEALSYAAHSTPHSLWKFEASGKLLSRTMGSSLVLQLSSRDKARQLSSADIYLTSLLELDKPLGQAANIGQLELEMGEYSAQILDSNVVKTTQQSPGSFLRIGLPGNYENSHIDTFLQHDQSYPGSVRINRIASNLMTDKQSSLEKVQVIMNYVAEFIDDEDVISESNISDILDTGRGDCSEHALLFVALSRAAGIPAREANGLLYLGDEQQKYSAHVWAEVDIEGEWVSVDPTWRKIKLDPGYIRVYGDNSSTKTTLLAISGKTIHVKQLNYL